MTDIADRLQGVKRLEIRRPVIGLAALSGSGKSHAAVVLMNRCFDPGFVTLSFAAPIRDMLCAMGLPAAALAGDARQAPHPFLQGRSPRYAMRHTDLRPRRRADPVLGVAGLIGLPWHTWAVREFLRTMPIGRCPLYGDMPVCREFRLFVDAGEVGCRHPYWPDHAGGRSWPEAGRGPSSK